MIVPTELRPPGMVILALIVLAGIVPGAGYFHWKAPEVKAEVIGKLSVAPGDPAEQLTLWLSYGEPQIQSRLTHLRFSTGYPWLITHTVEVAEGPPEIWGLELVGSHPAKIVREGLHVEIRLPEPSMLGHGILRGANANRIPSYPLGMQASDPAARANYLVSWFLGGLLEALPRDVEGADLTIRIGERNFDPPQED